MSVRTIKDPEARARVVSIAAREVDGAGDATGARYWAGTDVPKPYPAHWCGAFALWVLRQAGLTRAAWIVGRGFVYPLGLRQVARPEPGDIAYFSQHAHHAIVESVQGETVVTLDGNQPGFARRVRKRSDAAAYYSIESLIPDVEAPGAPPGDDGVGVAVALGVLALVLAWGFNGS